MNTRVLEKIEKMAEYWPEYSFVNFLDFLNFLEQAGCRKTCPMRLVCQNRCLSEQANEFGLNVFQTVNLATAVNFYFFFGDYLDPKKIFEEVYEYFFMDGGNPLDTYLDEEVQRIINFVEIFSLSQSSFNDNFADALTEFFSDFADGCLESSREKRGLVIFQGMRGDRDEWL